MKARKTWGWKKATRQRNETDVDDVDLDLGNGMQKEMMMGSEQQNTKKNNHLVVYRRWKAYIEVG
jgi:hypothetical protein